MILRAGNLVAFANSNAKASFRFDCLYRLLSVQLLCAFGFVSGFCQYLCLYLLAIAIGSTNQMCQLMHKRSISHIYTHLHCHAFEFVCSCEQSNYFNWIRSFFSLLLCLSKLAFILPSKYLVDSFFSSLLCIVDCLWCSKQRNANITQWVLKIWCYFILWKLWNLIQ